MDTDTKDRQEDYGRENSRLAGGRRPARIEPPSAGRVIFLSLIFLSLFVRSYPRVSA
jgi:hypothetical protein